jgi:hypothetical protein
MNKKPGRRQSRQKVSKKIDLLFIFLWLLFVLFLNKQIMQPLDTFIEWIPLLKKTNQKHTQNYNNHAV